jgi:hypothetical protein
MTTCKTLLLVSLLAKLQELPVSQLTKHVDPFHLVITDKWRPAAQLFSGKNTLRPSWCGPFYKAPYPFQPSCCTLNPRRLAQQSVLAINLCFLHMAWSLFGNSLPLPCVIQMSNSFSETLKDNTAQI